MRACDICGITFGLKADLRDHVVTHMSKESRLKHKCCYCSETFLTRFGVKKHQEKVHLKIIEKIVCECGKIFGNKANLKDHKKYKHMGALHTCKTCQATFDSQSKLRNHIAGAHTKMEQCTVCGQMISEIFIKAHVRRLHSTFICTVEECSRKYSTSAALYFHMESHPQFAKNFSCHSCDKKFAFQSVMRRHFYLSHNLIRIACEVTGCNHTASRKDYLVRHYRSHKEIDNKTRDAMIGKLKGRKGIDW